MIGPFAGDLKAPVTRQALMAVERVDREWFASLAAAVEERIREHAAGEGVDPATIKAEWSEAAGFMGGAFWLRIRARLFGQKFDTLTVRYPADWWQAVRQRFAPAWWLRRYPVVEVVREFTPRIIYPRLQIAAPTAPHVLNIDAITYRTDQVDDDEG
jgi:hypothetical protein